MFTRKHYIALARILKCERNTINQLSNGVNCEEISQAKHVTVNSLEYGLLILLCNDNPQFDRQRFLNASR